MSYSNFVLLLLAVVLTWKLLAVLLVNVTLDHKTSLKCQFFDIEIY